MKKLSIEPGDSARRAVYFGDMRIGLIRCYPEGVRFHVEGEPLTATDLEEIARELRVMAGESPTPAPWPKPGWLVIDRSGTRPASLGIFEIEWDALQRTRTERDARVVKVPLYTVAHEGYRVYGPVDVIPASKEGPAEQARLVARRAAEARAKELGLSEAEIVALRG